MFTTRIAFNLLRPRLNSEAYAPEHMAAEQSLRSSGLSVYSLADLVTEPINNSIRNVAAELDAPGAAIPMFRPADMSEGWLSAESAPKLRLGFERKHSKARVQPGDIVLGIAGTVGEIGRVPPSKAHGNINGSCARLVPREDYKGYLHGFIRSKYGQSSLIRWAVGAVQKHLNLEDLPGVLVAAPSAEPARLYIGNKVRQAETLRARARADREYARECLDQLSGTDVEPSFQQRPRRVLAGSVSEVSLSPSFVRALRGHQRIPGPVAIEKLIESCKCGDPIRADERRPGSYPYYGASGPIDVHDDFNFDGDYLVVAQDGSIGCTNVARGRFWANNHVWVLRLRSGYDLDALGAYLQDHYPYWLGLTTGSVIPKVTSENLLRICVPTAAVRATSDIGRPLRRARERESLSGRLTTSARLLVEALIERKVTEKELITAHTDPAADRALLSRLATDGFDGEAEPLFPDLDKLDALLKDAQEGAET